MERGEEIGEGGGDRRGNVANIANRCYACMQLAGLFTNHGKS